MKRVDIGRNLLFQCREGASPEFWDTIWKPDIFFQRIDQEKTRIDHAVKSVSQPDSFVRNLMLAGVKERMISSITGCYLTRGARILEGGCGTGMFVYFLRLLGYDACGVDYAEQTVRLINEKMPDLPVSLQDVRKMNFDDGSFDGYWSLGVIEHFLDGVEPVIRESHRILKRGGYLFVTVPYLSFIRRLKSCLRIYKHTPDAADYPDFYQFYFSASDLKKRIEPLGFTHVQSFPFNPIYGLQDECGAIGNLFRRMALSPSPAARMARLFCVVLFQRIAAHSILHVYRKQ